VTPPGTVTFRQDRTTAFDANALAWTLTPFQPPSASAWTGLASNLGETSLFPANVAITTAVFAPARPLPVTSLRFRALQPFPAYAKYNGAGSIESEANFTCMVD
jgi:hypothetical protein